jgi:manganese/zinc/iron transport system ATP- binding protein
MADQAIPRDETVAVVVHDLTAAYRETPVLWDVDVTIPAGTLTAIIGTNSAGKSTFIKVVLGLIPVAAGTVEISGHSTPKQRRLAGYVSQRGSVDWSFPTNALDVVTMGIHGQLGWIRRLGNRRVPVRCTPWIRSGWRILPAGRSASFQVVNSSGFSWHAP